MVESKEDEDLSVAERASHFWVLYNWDLPGSVRLFPSVKNQGKDRIFLGVPTPEEGDSLYLGRIVLPQVPSTEKEAIVWVREDESTMTRLGKEQAVEHYMLQRVPVCELTPPGSFGPGRPMTIIHHHNDPHSEENRIEVILESGTYDITITKQVKGTGGDENEGEPPDRSW